MVSLIISLIAIALIALTIAITMFDLGDTFTSGHEKAEFAKLQNEGGQISIATNLYITKNSGASPADVQELVDQKYLKSLPDGLKNQSASDDWAYNFNNFVSLSVSDEDVCMSLNESAGYTGSTPPLCSDGYNQNAPCCVSN